MTTDDTPSRRRLLHAGIAAGAGVAAVAAVASPASAATSDPVLVGRVNDTGTTGTTLSGGSATGPALLLQQTAAGRPLVLTPTPADKLTGGVPAGSLAVSPVGDLMIGGAVASSSRWANRTMPVAPMRILDTREVAKPGGWAGNIVSGRENIDSTGRMRAGSTLHVTLNYMPEIQYDNAVAAYLNFTVVNTVKAGFLNAYSPSQPRPTASSLNWWGPNQILSNLVEVQLGQTPGGAGFSFAIFVLSATSVVVDLSGLVLTNPLS